MGQKIMTPFVEQVIAEVATKQEEQHMSAQTKSTKYVTTVEIFPSTQFVITTSTTPTS
jgi:hypothetical protein